MPKISKYTSTATVGANDVIIINKSGVTMTTTAGALQTAPAGVTGPANNTDGYIPQWNGADSNTLKNGLSLVTTVGATGADTSIVSEQGIREAISTLTASPATNTDGYIPQWNGANSGTLKDGLALVTTVGATGVDTAIVSEQGIREALDLKAPKLFTHITQAATDTLSAAEVSGTVISNYGQSAENTQTLPAAALGYNGLVQIATAGAGAFHLKAGANDKIYLDGTALSDGDKASLATPAVGDYFSFWSFQTGATAYDWVVSSGQGTLTDGGA